MFKGIRLSGFLIAVAVVIITTVVICVTAVACSGGKLTFETTYYIVFYRLTDNSVSASSLSSTVSSYGGAGYILNYDGNYYVTVSCYFKENDAQTVCMSLQKRELDCGVLEINTENYKLESTAAKRNSQLYFGNLNTLHSLSSLAYECANCLDTGEYTQSKAKDVLLAIKDGLNALLHSNASNCFTNCLQSLIAECEDKESGYLYSREMRYLQIAITDAVINARLY